MARQAREYEQEFLANLEDRTEKNLPQWMEIIASSGQTKTNAIIKWLKGSFSLNHREATMLTGIFLNDGKPVYDYDAMFERLFDGKEAMRPLYDKLQQAITDAVPETEFIPTKTYISLESERVFACAKINAKNIRLGLDLGDAPYTERLLEAKGLGAMPNIAHMIELQDSADITDDVITAVRRAYDLSH